MGIDIYSMSGAKTGVTGFLITLAESYLISGNPQEALNTLEQCSECAQQTGEFIFSAAILEGKARVLCALDFSQNWSQAHALLVSSVESARASGTGHYELVALTTLARMQKEAGEDDSSTILDLHAAYHKYGQGLESKPMLAARALLD